MTTLRQSILSRLPLVFIAAMALRGTATEAASTTRPFDLTGIPVVRLWPGDAPATQPADVADAGETMTLRSPNKNPSLALSNVSRPALCVFIPPGRSKNPATAVVVCPGGGYLFESISNEGFSIAQKFAKHGIVAFVLKYRLPNGVPPEPGTLPVPQQDVLRAVQLVRAHAAAYGIDPHRVGVVGFSAGGHVAGSAATMFDEASMLPANDAVSKVSARPDFAVLVYPVVTMRPAFTHPGSRARLIGAGANEMLTKQYSIDERIKAGDPPIFLAQAKDDTTVPFKNAELLQQAAGRAGVSFTLVPFEHGGHGFGLGRTPETRTWFDACLRWMQNQGEFSVPVSVPRATDN